jgi:predicted RND superfamily exporter protein
MLAVVLHDMPLASYLSFLMTAIVVIVTSRRPRDAVLILVGLLTGVLWLAGVFSALHLKLNFLNFIALPITFGIGVDYAVNVTQRYREDPDAGPVAALRSSGGAVILCSLTTSLGYIALVGSKNQAVHSLGLLAVLGELSCLVAAVLVVPSVVAVASRRRTWKSRDPVSRIDEPTLMSASTNETGT